MSSKGFISIVVPAYNEQDVLRVFHERLSPVLAKLGVHVEVIYVNDGSSDGTLEILRSLKAADERVAILDLSRNFGKEIALTAGLDHASGDAVIVIDADLQDPPELIPEFLQRWHEGYDVVYARRTEREGESALKKATAYVFYRIMQRASHVKIPEDAGDFRLLSRRAVDSLRQLREHHRFMKGLFAWIGYPQKAVFYQREARAAGKTKWNYWRLWNFALEGITSFTTAPLRFATYIGLLTALASFVYAAIVIYKTLAFGESVRGYPSLMVAILFLGGVQLFTIGIIGEYLGRMFNEAKQRPLYIVKDYLPAGAPPKTPA
ncbi:MAG TPA: glycosyltransferase family 2 protein [Burkholderiales bacterium]|nr:glycosyltransferase family 2 protein [Burkholderiales bacterium]